MDRTAIRLTSPNGRYALITNAPEDIRPYYQAGTEVMRMHGPDGTPIGNGGWTPISTLGETVATLVLKALEHGSIYTEETP